MSELIQKHDNRATIRWKLLTSASALALSLATTSAANAEDSSQPQVWIELGGQFDKLQDSQEKFAPSFMAAVTIPNQLTALDVQRPPLYALDIDGSVSFQSKDSDWVFSAGIRYGRSHSKKSRHQQTKNPRIPFDWNLCSLGYCSVGKYGSYYPSSKVKFADGRSDQRERHLILDFEAGKDVGLGSLGQHGSSRVSAGIRIAQFSSGSNVDLRARPDLNYPATPLTNFLQFRNFKYYNSINFHNYAAVEAVSRQFHGIGPKLSWDASAAIAGTDASGEISLDWGVNAAVLFGRQVARGRHQTTSKTYHFNHWHTRAAEGGPYDKVGYFNVCVPTNCGFYGPEAQHTNVGEFSRAKSVTVPNLGGFAGISYRYANAKISVGYKVDYFFNAIDGGMDTRKSENRGFFGPYASISVGLGD